MNLVRFENPRYAVNRNLVNELYNNLWRNDYHENYLKNCKQPATNIFETDNDFRIEMLLPGFAKEDVQISYHKNLLTVKVDKATQETNADDREMENKEVYKYAHREFDTYNFEKQFKVPNSVNTEVIDAKFENGILKLVLPKKEEALEKAPKEIKIA